MALDSDEEWLLELLQPEPPPKRCRISDDDVEASQFLDELLISYSSARTCPALPAALPVMTAALPPRRAAMPCPRVAVRPALELGGELAIWLRGLPLESIAPIWPASPARPADRITVVSNIVQPSATSLPPQQAAVPKVVFRLPQSSNAGAILSHATQLVHNIIRQGPTIFKIGITADPAHRWGNDRYGYQHDRDEYQQMLVFSEADSAGAAMLEASLIKTFKQISGCRNTAPGGESVRHGCTTYTYIVFRHLDTVRAAGG